MPNPRNHGMLYCRAGSGRSAPDRPVPVRRVKTAYGVPSDRLRPSPDTAAKRFVFGGCQKDAGTQKTSGRAMKQSASVAERLVVGAWLLITALWVRCRHLGGL